MEQKRVPQRMCVICRKVKDKKELIRLARDSDGDIALDLDGKASGRGTYICREGDCFKRNVKAKQLNKIFKGTVTADSYAKLQKEIEAMRGETDA